MTETASPIADTIRSQAAGEYSGARAKPWSRFLDIALNTSLNDTLAAREAEDVIAAIRAMFELLARPRRSATIDAEVAAVAPAGSVCDTALATRAGDMPFFVDTVSMAIRATGAEIDWVLNVLVCTRRDENGELVELAAPGEDLPDSSRELLLRFEFAAPSDLDRDTLAEDVRARLTDLERVVGDWRSMLDKLEEVAADLDQPPAGASASDCEETAAFLRWLADNHFTLLGYRCRDLAKNDDDRGSMVDAPGSGLGLLRADRPNTDPDGYVASPAALERYSESSRILVVAKANARAWIHHNEAMDVVSVKRLDASGNSVGVHRFLGLFSAEAYATSPREIPLLRYKVAHVAERANVRKGSERAKNLNYILETFPRDELFQANEDRLYETVMGVLGMRETEKLRLFVRRDRYDRFFSCLVYVPRERYGRNLRARVGNALARALSGTIEHTDTRFLRGVFVRIYFHISAGEQIDKDFDEDALEQQLIEVARAWSDRYQEASKKAGVKLPVYARAFDAAYREHFSADTAIADAQVLSQLEAGDAPVLRVAGLTDAGDVRLKLYGSGDEIPLSRVLPIFERFGLSAHTQWPFTVEPKARSAQWIHEYEADHVDAEALVDAERAAAVCAAFDEVLAGRIENDGLNQLIISAALSPRQTVLVRAIARYLLQTDLPYSPAYVQDQLVAHPELMTRLVELFEKRFDPDRQNAGEPDTEAIDEALENIATLDADRVLRAFYATISACLRTNFFQYDADGRPKTYVSIKLASSGIPELPQPVPAFEAFVYAPAVEAIHLRGGKVARGGLRWSDRREDFRTEVLGLMKAQMVKNAVIVPVGAKGGFVVKTAPAEDTREARQNLGIACYRTFISGLLDITDNRDGDAIRAPERVVRYDDDDPYLVVAADKGTATFSDIANELSQDYGFWLDDAFASGGATGYDHKAMAITSRGAWESVRRHFREEGLDTQSEPFTVVGIGDMAGDVFGNGMLRSDQIRLVAAFNHIHIFIDPDPDAAAGFAERKRLFEAPRSSWDDYDRSKISEGGGVFQRAAKHIELSEPARRALGVESRRLTPNALIGAILRAPVDLFWNGGIGTYVKASTESNVAVGDRGNDSVRVNGADLRCRVVGEGGNLGFTQAGRIEFALAGGRINTDAIDNSGGVDCSDLEVNIKIALGAVEAAGEIDRAARNELLGQMSDGVAERVLRTNYRQNQQLSLMLSDALSRFEEQASFMRMLERNDWLDRRLEQLPDEDTLADRQGQRKGLVRPELSVLLAYAKIALANAVISSKLPDDPWLDTLLDAGFPDELVERFPKSLSQHRLKRELVTTRIVNRMVDRMGIATANQLPVGFNTDISGAAEAYLLADAWLGSEALFQQVEALDGRIGVELQYGLHKIIIRLTKHAMTWWLGIDESGHDLGQLVERYQAGAQKLLHELSSYLSGDYQRRWTEDRDAWQEDGLDADMAAAVANANSGGGIMDVVALADAFDRDVGDVAGIYFELGDELGIPSLQDQIHKVVAEGRWQALARASLRNDSYRLHQQIVGQVLAQRGDDPLSVWREANADTVEFIKTRMRELASIDRADHAHLIVMVRDLARLTTLKPQSLTPLPAAAAS